MQCFIVPLKMKMMLLLPFEIEDSTQCSRYWLDHAGMIRQLICGVIWVDLYNRTFKQKFLSRREWLRCAMRVVFELVWWKSASSLWNPYSLDGEGCPQDGNCTAAHRSITTMFMWSKRKRSPGRGYDIKRPTCYYSASQGHHSQCQQIDFSKLQASSTAYLVYGINCKQMLRFLAGSPGPPYDTVEKRRHPSSQCNQWAISGGYSLCIRILLKISTDNVDQSGIIQDIFGKSGTIRALECDADGGIYGRSDADAFKRPKWGEPWWRQYFAVW